MPLVTRNFSAWTMQLPGLKGNPPLPIITGLLEETGQLEQPKVISVPILLGKSQKNAFALYSASQGRNVGRRGDFDDVYRIGGRVVDRTESPEHGVVEISPVPEKFEDYLANRYPWPVSQILWIDGPIWISLVRDGEVWRERERFSTESLHSRSHDWVDTPDKAGAEFYEFLHRAFLRWDIADQPEVSAQYVASHARSFHPGRRIGEFAAKFADRCGFATNDEELLANIVRASVFLEQVRRILAGQNKPPGSHTDWLFSTFDATPALRMLIEAVAPHYGNDAFVSTFCRVFLAEIFAPKELPEKFDQDSMRAASRQAESVVGMLPVANDAELRFIDGNAGYGDYLLAVIEQLSKIENNYSIIACEANPVAYQVACLRVECALKMAKLPAATIELRNMYRDGIAENLAGICVFLGEAHPHVIKGASLEVNRDEGHKARYGWGKKLQNQDIAIARYLEAIESAGRRSETVARLFSLRLPAEWAEDMKQADSRKRFFAMAGTVFVDDSEVNEQLVDRRMSRGDIVVLAGDMNPEIPAPPEPYSRVSPLEQVGFSLIPGHSANQYMTWPALPELFLDKPLNGPIERRGMTMIDIDREKLAERLDDYFSEMPPELLRERCPEMVTDTKQFDARETRKRLREQGFSPDNITRYSFRPFDTRYIYAKDARPLFSEPATALFALADAGDSFLVASAGNPRTDMGVPAWFGVRPCDYDFFAGRSGHFPIWIKETIRVGKERHEVKTHNLSEKIRKHLDGLGFKAPEQSEDTANLLWRHALAVLNTPAYLKENREALRLSWPRIPVPGLGDDRSVEEAKNLLEHSAALGHRVANLLAFADGQGERRIREVGHLFIDNSPVDPEDAGKQALAINADWGTKIKGKGGAVRPRPGSVTERPYWPGEKDALQAGSDLDAVLGDHAVDVWFNQSAYWSGVPVKVWEYAIGGRRVLSKWLSYREVSILGRPLHPEEVRFFGDMIRRLTELLLVGVELDWLWRRTQK